VLNSSYECISQTSLGRALVLVEEKKAEVVRWAGKFISSASGLFRVPLMIRVFKYIRAFGRALRFTNRFVWERDDYHCMYCGKKITSKADLTTDHVIPRSLGGKTIYENMVACCRKCNERKDNKTPEQAHMRLLKKPFRPQMSKQMAKMAEEAREIMLKEEGLWQDNSESLN
jgi:hypothetical protein